MKQVFFMVFWLIAFSAYSQPVTDGLLGYWTFSGNALDESGNGHDGLVVGPELAADRHGNLEEAYSFNLDDKIGITNDVAFNFGTSDFTISAWYRSGWNGNGSLIAKQSTSYEGWNLWYASGTIKMVLGTNSYWGIVKSSAHNDQQWHHVVFSRIGNNPHDWKLYIDGVLDVIVESNNLANPDISTSSAMFVGRRGDGNTFNGPIDEIAIFNRALSHSEVLELFAHNSEPAVVNAWQANGENIFYDGNSVGIGTDSPDEKLTVKGGIHAQRIKVDLNGALVPDFVFELNYALPTLPETEQYILANKHLRGIPSAEKMEKEGLELKEMNLLLLQKIEELTLYLIDQNKKIENQQREIETLKKKPH